MKRLPVWISIAAAAFVAAPALAGFRIEFKESNSTTSPSRPETHGYWTRTIEVDGSRFYIVNPNGPMETSVDDGATSWFNNVKSETQTPLAPRRSAKSGSWLDQISVSVEDEKLTVGKPVAGPNLAGIATRTYAVDYTYVTVTQVGGVTSRTPIDEHYDVWIGDIDVSPAAVRVVLSRGFGQALAQKATAFLGFPLRIDGRLVTGRPETGLYSTTFRLEAISVAPWSWSDR